LPRLSNVNQGDLLPPATYKDIRRSDMIEELRREIGMRKHVYPRQVAAGKMDPITADRRILIMQAVLKEIDT